MKKPLIPKKIARGLPKTSGPLDFVHPRYVVVVPLDRSIIEREIDQ